MNRALFCENVKCQHIEDKSQIRKISGKNSNFLASVCKEQFVKCVKADTTNLFPSKVITRIEILNCLATLITPTHFNIAVGSKDLTQLIPDLFYQCHNKYLLFGWLYNSCILSFYYTKVNKKNYKKQEKIASNN